MAPPLTPASILDGMAAALPTHAKDDTTSDLSSSLDAVALFTHACFVSVGFRLLGFSEEKPEESECQSLAPHLPSTWNRSLSSHCFIYAHEQSSMRFVIRVDRMGSKIEIRGLGVGDERIARFDITTRDYVSAAALPIRITITNDGQGEEDRSDLPEKLKKVFISEERIADLSSLLKINIIQRLIPGLQKEGYQEDPDDRAARQDADDAGRRAGGSRNPPGPPMMPNPMPDPAQPYPYQNDLDPPPRRPVPAGDFPPPDFEDEYEINRHPRAGGGLPGLVGGPNPTPGLGGGRSDYGRSDLYPAGLGPDDPIRGSFAHRLVDCRGLEGADLVDLVVVDLEGLVGCIRLLMIRFSRDPVEVMKEMEGMMIKRRLGLGGTLLALEVRRGLGEIGLAVMDGEGEDLEAVDLVEGVALEGLEGILSDGGK